MLGTNEEHVIYTNKFGNLLRDNANIFLSKRIINTFGSYASAQLRRLQNALAKDEYPQKEKEKHILNTIKNQMNHFAANYSTFSNGSMNLYIDKSEKQNIESEIYIDINLKKYPLRDFANIYSEMNNVVKDYSKLNHRNSKKEEAKLLKHAMHLIRLLITGTEILSEQMINTYRTYDKELLMDIRLGKYTYNEIFEMVDLYENKFIEASHKTTLPNEPDKDTVNNLLMNMYEAYYYL